MLLVQIMAFVIRQGIVFVIILMELPVKISVDAYMALVLTVSVPVM